MDLVQLYKQCLWCGVDPCLISVKHTLRGAVGFDLRPKRLRFSPIADREYQSLWVTMQCGATEVQETLIFVVSY